MIEDMKNMMTDITQRMNEFDEKMDTISADVKTMTDITNKTKRVRYYLIRLKIMSILSDKIFEW